MQILLRITDLRTLIHSYKKQTYKLVCCYLWGIVGLEHTLLVDLKVEENLSV